MKNVIILLLFCLVFESVITPKRSLKHQIAKVVANLEETNEVINDINYETSAQTTPPVETYYETPQDEPERAIVTSENAAVEASKPVSTKPKTTENKKAKVQITKFYGFKAPSGPGTVTFGVLFYFLGRPIVRFIVMRLRITYHTRLRNLQTIAESARSDCTIVDESLVGLILSSEEGKNTNYNCEAKATLGDASNANFTLNTDVSMTMVNVDDTSESLDFQDINFIGEASKESVSIQENLQEVNGVYSLKNTLVSVEKSILKFIGTLEQSGRRRRRLARDDEEEITMNLLDNEGVVKKYICTIKELSSAETELNCDTSSSPITTTVSRLHLSSGSTSDGYLLTIEMSDYDTNSTLIATAISREEVKSATSEDIPIDANTQVSSKGYESDDKGAEVQIVKFHSFKLRNGNISFGSFFYLFGRQIPKFVIFRSRITYESRLRNLQETAHSVKTTCTTEDSMVGETLSDGKYVDYNCEAKPYGDISKAKVQLNTDIDLVMEDANGKSIGSLSFNNINFNGNTTEEAKNIQSSTDSIQFFYTLKNAVASFNRYTLKLSGLLVKSTRLLRRLALAEGQTLDMNLMTNEDGKDITIPYKCTINGISSSTTVLNCDTSENEIKTTVENLHLSVGGTSDTLLLVEMDNWKNNRTYSIESPTFSNYIDSKSSGGLNGGAIAGIIIACVVVLVAAVIAGVMLRKPPTPPVSNTTIMDLKNNPI